MLEMFEKIEKKYWQDKIKKISKFRVIKMQDLDDAKVMALLQIVGGDKLIIPFC
ncbi:hypothetical protein [Escherichia coli]|uniref:hypothetical protein n=1 Tax=Escherichia coli TaxID=562 RepID=UPI0031344DC9